MKPRQMMERMLWGLAMAGSLLLGGCGGGSGSSGGNMAAPADFNSFVKDTLATSEATEPRDVNDREFTFSDEPDAFDEVLD